jgi:hypothetical protein
MKTPPKPAVAKGGVPLPPGAHHVPGSKAYRAVQGAPHPGEVQIGLPGQRSPWVRRGYHTKEAHSRGGRQAPRGPLTDRCQIAVSA